MEAEETPCNGCHSGTPSLMLSKPAPWRLHSMPTQNSGLAPSSPFSASLTSSLTLRQSATVVQSGFSHSTCILLFLLLFLAAANRSSKSCICNVVKIDPRLREIVSLLNSRIRTYVTSFCLSLDVVEVGRADDHGIDVVILEEVFVVAEELDGFGPGKGLAPCGGVRKI